MGACALRDCSFLPQTIHAVEPHLIFRDPLTSRDAHALLRDLF